MSKRYGYQNQGETRSMSIGSWVLSLSVANPVVRGLFNHGVVMEIILTWLWVVGLVAFLVLVGSLFRGRPKRQSSRGSYYLEARLLPKHLEFFRQRYTNSKSFSHLS